MTGADIVERLRARTFSRWESDIQAVMEYEDDLCAEAADEIERLRRERDALAKAIDPEDNRPALMARIIMASVERLVRAEAAEAKISEMRKDMADAEELIRLHGKPWPAPMLDVWRILSGALSDAKEQAG
jgi:hypothetical protein